MNCERCWRPLSPRVYLDGKDNDGNPIKVDESGVGGRQSLPGECNRRSATGLVQCMELELGILRSIRMAQAETITKQHDDNQVLKKTVLDLQSQLGIGEQQHEILKRTVVTLGTQVETCLSELGICTTALARSGPCTVPHLEVFYKEFSERFKHWTVRAFGKEVWFNRQERALRLLEETFELCQAIGISYYLIEKLLNRTYSRPIGEVSQEVTGVFNCILALAASQNLDLPLIYEKEVKRLEEGNVLFFREKQALKYADGVGLYPTPSENL